MQRDELYPFETLPDYLAPGMRLPLVGINPSIYSVQYGHHVVRKTSRFWPAFSRSRLSREVRGALGRDVLGPEDDARLLDVGVGLTDVVKVPSADAAQVAWYDRLADFLDSPEAERGASLEPPRLG